MPWDDDDDRECDDEDEDWSDDDEVDTIPCPHCGQDVHEEAQFCPRCENYLSEEDSPSPPKPWWMLIGALLAMGVALTWIMG